jgi:mannose-1-phosphate guanylyltransferase
MCKAVWSDQEPSALILAGGDGNRLRSLTRRIVGDERPKQFCPILGQKTLLEQTRRRTALVIPPDRTSLVVVRAHHRFYVPLVADEPVGTLLVQPENRGTAPAIVLGLLHLADMAPGGPVAIFPSDHYVSDDEVFMAHVEDAFRVLQDRPDLLILLGITPDSPEVGYGWIEPAGAIGGQEARTLYRVRQFWEKPSFALARDLLAHGCLWNSFVMVSYIPTLLALVRRTLPDLYHRFAGIRPAFNTLGEEEALRWLYARLPSMNFSHGVLAACPANLAVLPVNGTDWSDWGEPRRVLATLARLGIRPQWAKPGAALPA